MCCCTAAAAPPSASCRGRQNGSGTGRSEPNPGRARTRAGNATRPATKRCDVSHPRTRPSRLDIKRLLRNLLARYFPGVFTRPDDITEGQIRAELAASWNFAAQTLSYLPVGFGSHHWRATNAAGRQLFLIVHDLPQMLHSRLDTAEAAFGRLVTAFECALSVRRDENLEFVIAPVPTVNGTVVRRLSVRYSLAVCPYLTDCEPADADEFPEADRPAVVRLLTELHRATPPAAPQRCDFGLQNADGLRAAKRA